MEHKNTIFTHAIAFYGKNGRNDALKAAQKACAKIFVGNTFEDFMALLQALNKFEGVDCIERSKGHLEVHSDKEDIDMQQWQADLVNSVMREAKVAKITIELHGVDTLQ